MSEELQIGRQWLAKARNDLLNADNNLASKEIPYDTVCFHCQQAAEKLLKAYLIGNGHAPPITHDLFLALEKILPKRYENIAKGTIRRILNAVKNHNLEKVNTSNLNCSVKPINIR